VNLLTGPLLGHFVDVDGTTRDLVDVSLTATAGSNGTATGDFVAAFSTTGVAGPITVTGSFRACNPLVGGCPSDP
jgi:hypothetical protein